VSSACNECADCLYYASQRRVEERPPEGNRMGCGYSIRVQQLSSSLASFIGSARTIHL